MATADAMVAALCQVLLGKMLMIDAWLPNAGHVQLWLLWKG